MDLKMKTRDQHGSLNKSDMELEEHLRRLVRESKREPHAPKC